MTMLKPKRTGSTVAGLRRHSKSTKVGLTASLLAGTLLSSTLLSSTLLSSTPLSSMAFATVPAATAAPLSHRGSALGAAGASGGTVTWAEGPQTPPNYIFPLVSAQNSSAASISDFQYLMYRPLYWFGNNNSPTVDFSDSLGQPPVFSDGGRTVTIKLNHYVWSNGEVLSSRDVIFWMNLLKANTVDMYSYVTGYFPDNVMSMSAPDPTTVVFNLDKAYNPKWFLYNELSQITPLPMAWDRTSLTDPVPAAGAASLPDTTPAGAKAVYTFLDAQAKIQTTWATSPIWGVVDGPFRLEAYTNTGQATLVPNPTYTGPVKPRIAKLIEEPFTGDLSEFEQVRSGPSHLTVGYLPPGDLPQLSSIESEGYKQVGGYVFAAGYFPLNLNNPTIGPVFRQTYFRQAFQHLVDQTGWVKAFYHGAASPAYGPVPLQPPNALADPAEHRDRFPYSISAAAAMLKAHGWNVKPGGLTTCARPGTGPTDCGAGVPVGFGITFNIDYSSGIVALAESMKDLKSSADQVGINVELTAHPYGAVVSRATPCQPSQSVCSWTAQNWGGGWSYAPDFYPTGEELFQTGAAANYENWNDPVATRLIQATTTGSQASAQAALNRYQDYLAQQVPVVFNPELGGNPVQGYPAVVSARLGGYSTNVYQIITPEYWYLKG